MKGISRRGFLAHSVLSGLMGFVLPTGSFAEKKKTLAWRNWSGNLLSNPSTRFSPRNELELVEFLQQSSGSLRTVGSGHSFSPLVPTDGDLVIIDQLSGLQGHDRSVLMASRATSLLQQGHTTAGPVLMLLPPSTAAMLAAIAALLISSSGASTGAVRTS